MVKETVHKKQWFYITWILLSYSIVPGVGKLSILSQKAINMSTFLYHNTQTLTTRFYVTKHFPFCSEFALYNPTMWNLLFLHS